MKAREVIWTEVCKYLSQFFQRRRRFSSQLKERSTIHRFGKIPNWCNSLRLTSFTVAPCIFLIVFANLSPEYPPSTRKIFTAEREFMLRAIICSASYISRCNMDCMRQAESIYYDIQFYSWNLFSSVISFFLDSIRIFYAFCIYDTKRSFIFFWAIIAYYFD